jgi:hypothetical protein
MTLEEYEDVVFALVCGCGAPNDVLALVFGFLTRLAGGTNDVSSVARDWFLAETKQDDDTDALPWVFYYWLGGHGIVEHGCSARFCWLTEKGKSLYEAMLTYGADIGVFNERV